MSEFISQREQLLAPLGPLTSTQWSRTATIKASAKAATWTVLSYAERLASHEFHHLSQFARVAAAFEAQRAGD